MSKKIEKVSLLFFGFIGFMVVLSLLFYAYTDKEKPKIIVDATKIIVSCDFQDYYPEKGKQKIVVHVENKSDKIFNGNLKIEISESGMLEFYEILSVDNLQAGKKTYGILWIDKVIYPSFEYRWL